MLLDGFFDMASEPSQLKALESEGFPILKKSEIPPCGSDVACTKEGIYFDSHDAIYHPVTNSSNAHVQSSSMAY